MLREKVGRNEISQLVSDKVGKEELADYLPDMDGYDLKTKNLIREEISSLKSSITETIRAWDLKLVSLRKELDPDAIARLIQSKADQQTLDEEINGLDFKVGTLDRNLVCIATDFETFQKAINKMHLSLVSL